MDNNFSKPLLSICIPTYNRCQYLKHAIDSIICQKEFTVGEVEIVVSDNCSTDDTSRICQSYREIYPNFIYNRNERNVGFENFPIVMKMANGVYRKLSNDTHVYENDALEYMVNVIKEHVREQSLIMFSNLGGKCVTVTNTLEELMYKISFHITWIGAIGLWAEDVSFFEGTEKEYKSCLWQVPVFMDAFIRHGRCIIVDRTLSKIQIVEKKDLSYGLYDIFYINYMNYIKKYEKNGYLKNACVDFLERDILYKFFTEWIINYEINRKQYYIAEKDNTLKERIFSTYSKKEYFSRYKVYFYYRLFRQKAVRFIKNVLKIK